MASLVMGPIRSPRGRQKFWRGELLLLPTAEGYGAFRELQECSRLWQMAQRASER